jgi:prepilin-type N-terminal cleavage/methylation domain-containing protein
MKKKNIGFTLVELLVVIAIIAILAAILMPAMNAALKKASVTQAQTEVKSLEAAVKAYLNEYSRFPGGNGNANDFSYGPLGDARDNRVLANALRSVLAVGNTPNYSNNLRKIAFLEVQKDSLNADGDFVDPWGTPYEVTVDGNFDNSCTTPGASGYGTVAGKSVLVWSHGANTNANTGDEIRSW